MAKSLHSGSTVSIFVLDESSAILEPGRDWNHLGIFVKDSKIIS